MMIFQSCHIFLHVLASSHKEVSFSSIYVFESVWTQGCLFHFTGYNPLLLFCLDAEIVPDLCVPLMRPILRAVPFW